MNNALFIGRAVLDITSLVEDFPGPDGKATALVNDVIPGGTALNAAVVYSHLGGQARLATSLGSPGFAYDCLASDLHENGVIIQDICNDPNYSIPISTVVSTRSLGMRMIVNGAGDDCQQIKCCPDVFTDELDLIQLDQYERYFVMQHREEIRSFKGPVVLDGGRWKDCSRDFLQMSDIPIVSEVFCAGGPAQFSSMCTELDIHRWAMTRGPHGIIWRDGNREGIIPAQPVKAIDSMGAGDFFHGAFCHEFVQSGAFVESLAFANRVAARSCESVGTRSWMRG